jgi:hypothetical protein
MKQIQAYGCDYCSMTSRYKGHVIRHEKSRCRKNPNRSHCKGCVNLEFESETRGSGCPMKPEIYGNYEPYEPPHWWCNVTEDNIEYDELLKTRECEHFKLRED